jgi:hypothetical protein
MDDFRCTFDLMTLATYRQIANDVGENSMQERQSMELL